MCAFMFSLDTTSELEKQFSLDFINSWRILPKISGPINNGLNPYMYNLL